MIKTQADLRQWLDEKMSQGKLRVLVDNRKARVVVKATGSHLDRLVLSLLVRDQLSATIRSDVVAFWMAWLQRRRLVIRYTNDWQWAHPWRSLRGWWASWRGEC